MLTLTGYWPFGLVMCDVWQLSDVVMCTSSIMHMCTISLDRYTAIRDPLRSRAARGRSPTTFWVKIGAVWMTSVVIGSPLIVVGVLSPGDLLSEDGQCAIINPYYLVYGSLSAFFCPLTIMLVTFILTVRLLEREATQLGADGSGGMRRCTAERKAYPQLTSAARTTGAAAPASAGQRGPSMRSSWMSRFSRSEAPTTTSMLPSPNKFPHEIALPNTTSGPDIGDVPRPADCAASCRTSRDGDVVKRTETEATSSKTACRDKLGPVEIGSCVVDVSTCTHPPHTALCSTSDDVTNVESSSVSGSRVAAASGDILRSANATSARDVTSVTSSSGEAVADKQMPASNRSTDEQRNSTRLVKSTSEFSTLRLPEIVSHRRSVAVTSLDSSGKVSERLRHVMVSLHPGHVNGERCCLLKHVDDVKRYVADDDVMKPVPVELSGDAQYSCDQYRGAPRVSGSTVTEAVAMRRSRSDSAVGIQPPTCSHGDVIQSRDRPTAPTKNLDDGDPVADLVADTQRPPAADPAIATAEMSATGDVIVADVDEDNGAGTGNLNRGQMIRSTSGADRFRGLVRKHGPAFQVAGMLKATREDRQQKAFNSVKTESKAVKVLGTMFAIFVTCWAPFFTANLTMGVCSTCNVDPLLFKVYRCNQKFDFCARQHML